MKRLLVIDDEEQFRLMMRRLLEKEGYEVSEAADGDEGLEACRISKPDVVITDIIMPEKEGIETILSMRKEFPDMKIIAVSGGGRNAPGNYLILAERLGAHVTMEKPLDRARLLQAVERLTVA